MKNAIAIALTLLIAVLLALADETPEKVFLDLENRIAHAVIAKDGAELNKLYTSDYVTVGSTGLIRSKAEVIDAVTSGRRAVSAAQIEKITVRQSGDTAIIVGFLTMSGKDGDKDMSGRFAFTRVYRRESGEWHAVSFQATPAK
jgi:ketosteroid isomerase-like protein